MSSGFGSFSCLYYCEAFSYIVKSEWMKGCGDMADNSFHTTYLKQLPSLRRFVARYVMRSEDVEDILQETYVRTANKDVGLIKSPKAYLYRAARNIALNELNRKSNSVTGFIDDIVDGEMGDDFVAVDDQVHNKIQLETFAHAVTLLPKQCRKVFLLRKLYGLTHKEIAKRLTISVSTVETHLAKGLFKCSEYMQSRGYGMEEFKVINVQFSKKGQGS